MMKYASEITYWHTRMDKQAFTKVNYFSVRRRLGMTTENETLVSRPISSRIEATGWGELARGDTPPSFLGVHFPSR